MYKKIVIILVTLFLNGLAQNSNESEDFSYAIKLYEEKFYDLAAQQFIRFSNNFPKSEKLDEAGFYAGMSLFRMGEFENARIEFQTVGVNFPKSKRAAESWLMSGECYLKNANYEDAAKAFERVKTLYSNDPLAPESSFKAAEAYFSAQNYEKAEQMLNTIQERYVESSFYSRALLTHGKLYFQLARYNSAKEKLGKVLDLQAPSDVRSESVFWQAKIAHLQGFLGEAEVNYKKVIDSFTDSPVFRDAVIALAELKLNRGQFRDAQSLLRKGIDNNPNPRQRTKLLELLGDAHYLEGQYALAVKSYENAQNADTSASALIRIKTAFCWNKQNNLPKSIEIMENILESENINSLEGYSIFEEILFDWYEKSGKNDKAIEKLNRIKSGVDLSANQTELLISFLRKKSAWQLIILEAEAKALNDQEFPEKDDFVIELAQAYEKIGNFEKSAFYYDLILNKYPAGKYYNEASEKLAYLRDFLVMDQNIGISRLAVLIGDILRNEDKSQLHYKLGQIYYQELKQYESAVEQFEQSMALSNNSVLTAQNHYQLGLVYSKLAQKFESVTEKHADYLAKSKTYLKMAMENSAGLDNADKIANSFVEAGIQNDNPPNSKKISYYTSLLTNYKDSELRENWLVNLGDLYAQNDSTLGKALQYYNLAIESFPDSRYLPDYLFKKSELLLESDYPSAVEAYRKIVADFPFSQHSAQALYRLAEHYEFSNQFEAAQQLYTILLNDYYYTDFALKTREKIGDIYLYTGKYDDAIAVYEQQLKNLFLTDYVLKQEFLQQDQTNIYFKLGKAYFFKDKLPTAQTLLNTYLTMVSDTRYKDEAFLIMGDLYLQLNDKTAAVNNYIKVGAADKLKYKTALQKAATIYFELGEYKQASILFDQLGQVEDEPDLKAEAVSKSIISMIRNGQKSAAETRISTFKKEYKNNDEPLAAFEFELGDYYRKSGNFNAAEKYFQNVIKKYKNSGFADDAEYFLALTYLTLNKNKESLDILTNFTSKYPGSDRISAVLNTLGNIYFRSEKYESAIITFKSALDKNKDFGLKQQIMTNLIRAYTFVNFWDAALALSREYIQLYPDSDDVIDKKIIIAQAYVNLNQFDKAVELLKQTRLEADSEKEPEIQFYIGDAYLKSGQYENAIAEFVKIPLLSRKTKLQWEASALYYSGQAYEKMGRTDDAIRMYNEIVKRPGIDIILKKDAQKRIEQIKS